VATWHDMPHGSGLSTERSDALSESSITSLAINELSAIVPHLTRILAESVEADRGAIFVYSEDLASTEALFRYGYDSTSLMAHQWTNNLNPRDIPAERYVIENRVPLHRVSEADFKQYPLVNPGQERAEGRLVDLSIPLIWNDQVHGSAYLWRKDDPSPFTADEIRRAQEIGRLTAMTIVFARQYQRERQRGYRLDALLRVADVMAASSSFESVLETLVDSVRSITGADVAAMYVFDDDDQYVLTAAQSGMIDDEREMFRDSLLVPVTDIPAELVMRRTLEPMLVRDFEKQLSVESEFGKYAIQRQISEILLLPIVWKSQIVGIVYCWYRESHRLFSSTAIDSGEAIANQAGGLVARTRLEDMIRRQTAESEALMRIGQAVLKSETINPVLDEIAGALEQLIPFSYASYGMVTSDGESIRVMREWGDQYKPIIGTLIPVAVSISGESIRKRGPVTSDEVLGDPRAWKNVPSGVPLSAVISAPLIFGNRVFGNILLARQSTFRFTARESRLLELLSQQAAVAIERVRSRDTIARRAERQSFLAKIGDLLVGTENPESVLQQIADTAVGAVADGVLIGLSGWEYGSLRWVADSLDDPVTREKLHRGLHHLDLEALRDFLEAILVSNHEFVFPISRIPDELGFVRTFFRDLGISSMIVVPLFQHDRAPGLMVLMFRSEIDDARDDNIELGRIVADRIGDALERQQIKRNQEGLLRVSEALHTPSSLQSLIRTVANELQRILPCNQLIIADLLPEQFQFHTQAYRQHGVEHPGREFFPAEDGICGEAIAIGRPIMDNQADVRETSIYASDGERMFYRREGESALASPLIVDDEIVGVIFMNRTGRHRFTQADFETFMLFAGLAGAAIDRTKLEQSNRELYRASTEVLAAVVDAKDPTTLEHSRHVAVYSRELAIAMDLPREEIGRIELAGLLHDVGKLGIPDHILRKAERLTDEEFALIKTHPDQGAAILERHPALTDLVPMVRHHHERVDGRGYPSGLSGGEIPVGAAIICVADAFDTMTSWRTYQRQRSVEDALSELERCAGSQFDPVLVRRFVSRIRTCPDLIQVTLHDEPAD
jgi:HD-GYP domain-containing protein (c-di-GMP phosphodiesterase class II)